VKGSECDRTAVCVLWLHRMCHRDRVTSQYYASAQTATVIPCWGQLPAGCLQGMFNMRDMAW
jgi:hypothetical protein